MTSTYQPFVVADEHVGKQISVFLKDAKIIGSGASKAHVAEWIDQQLILALPAAPSTQHSSSKQQSKKKHSRRDADSDEDEAEEDGSNHTAHQSAKTLKAKHKVLLGETILVHKSILPQQQQKSQHVDEAHAPQQAAAIVAATPSGASSSSSAQQAGDLLDVVYEDNDIAIINKPVGMVVHPSTNGFQQNEDTLVHQLLRRYGVAGLSKGEPDEKDPSLPGIRPGIVHRIDKDTSGLLVIAKNDAAHDALKKQFQEHKTVVRTYLTIVHNLMVQDIGTIDMPIAPHPQIPNKRIAVTKISENDDRSDITDSKPAVTHYEVIRRFELPHAKQGANRFSYLRCRLETGRTHQIRVHLSTIGRPLLGDALYGPKNQPAWLSDVLSGRAPSSAAHSKAKHRSSKPQAHAMLNNNGGQLLHAATLSFVHPTTGKQVDFEAEPPSPFLAVLEYLNSKSAPVSTTDTNEYDDAF